jgi:autotransporter-associated beta strand protein
VAYSTADTLSLGGSGANFNASSIGTTFQGFGSYTVSSGTWTLSGSTPAGMTWTVLSGGTLSLTSDAPLGPLTNNLVLAGGTLQTGSFMFSTRNLTLAAGTMSTISSPNTFTFQGAINGSGGLIVAAGTTFQIGIGQSGSFASLYSGPTVIQSGATVQIEAGSFVLSANSAFTINAGGVLDLAGTTQSIGSLAGAGTVTNSGFGTGVLWANGNNGSTVFSGVLQDGASPLALQKYGSGTLTLLGANTYSGGTTVVAGTLQGNTTSLQGNIVNNAQVVFVQPLNGRYTGSMSGSGGLTVQGPGTLHLTGANSYTGGTTVAAGATLRGGPTTVQGHITNNGAVILETDTSGTYAGNMGGSGMLTKLGSGVLTLGGFNSYSGGTTVSAGTLQGSTTSLQGTIVNNAAVVFNQTTTGTYAGSMSGNGSLALTGGGTLLVSGASTYSGPTLIQQGRLQVSGGNNILSAASDFTISSGAVLDLGGTGQAISSLAGGGTVTNSASGRFATLTVGGTGASSQFSGSLQDGAAQLALVKTGGGVLYLSGPSTYSGYTLVDQGRLHVTGGDNVLSPNSAFILNRGATLDLGGSQTVASLEGSGTVTSTRAGLGTLTAGTNNASTKFDGVLKDGGNGGVLAVVKVGTGTWNLLGANTYSGGTTVSAGALQGNSTSLQGNILNNSLVIFHQDNNVANNTYAGSLSGNGVLYIRGGGGLSMTGNSTGFTGPTTVFGTSLALNGNLGASSVTLDTGSTLSGNGTVGNLLSNASILAPGNSIGTLSVNGTFAQSGGTYQLDVNGQGQSDLINVGGTAVLSGGVVQVQAAQGSYAKSTTYTIVSAAGGLSGQFGGTTDNFAFLTPTLSYDANNAYLTLALQGGAFHRGGHTTNQKNTGGGIDQSYGSATGDWATVIAALAGLNSAQGAAALDVISGQPWADMGSMNLAGTTMFMNAVAQQMALARGGNSGGGQRQALAQACEIALCEGVSPFSIWGGVLGGTGSMVGDGNASGITYTQGGAAVGIDYRVDPRFLVGLGVGYSSGSLWVNNFQGKGWNNAATASLYASFTQGGFYADALAGFGYASNQMQRSIVIPNLNPRVASSSPGANQYLGQVEIGYQVPVYAPAQATVTPFGRVQVINVTQNAFTEWGANSLDLNVQQQATNALRSTFGAQLNGNVPLGEQGSLALLLRLGWQHEFAYTGRPMTASFAGAPSAFFTVYGTAPQRDAAVIGLQADTQVADKLHAYLRYDGEIASGNDNHALTAGLRFAW